MYDKLTSQLNIKESELQQKQNKINELQSELTRTIAALSDFH